MPCYAAIISSNTTRAAAMGLGDNLMASGMAKGAKDRGKRIAFGDGNKIIWDHHSEQIFRKNPNIAFPGCERDPDLHWIPFYRGRRIYNTQGHNRWIWNRQFKAEPGEMYFAQEELQYASWAAPKGCIVIEPNVPSQKACAPNKQWPVARYEILARQLKNNFPVIQFAGTGPAVLSAQQVKSPNFRHALAVLKNAALYIGPEGGLHHGSAAMGIHAVVLFGGFIPPAVTGYDFHTNLTGGEEACGSLNPCDHCRRAMGRISVDEVEAVAMAYLNGRN